MKNRKPSPEEMKRVAKVLLANEIHNQKIFLDATLKKVEELEKKIISGDTSVTAELQSEYENALKIKNWLETNTKK